jgi:hypothetical protein
MLVRSAPLRDPDLPIIARFDGGELIGRARLAAAAPDLARALLAVEWAAEHPAVGAHCPMCNGFPPGVAEASPGGHRAGCALDAALRKAGVR